ncbi:agmatinase [Vibrio ponticus]|nr:agmatinase [Vibrio ponticus]
MNDLFSKTDYSLYSNSMSFMRRPYLRNPIGSDADVVVLGVPLDMATSGRQVLVWVLTLSVALQ